MCGWGNLMNPSRTRFVPLATIVLSNLKNQYYQQQGDNESSHNVTVDRCRSEAPAVPV